MIDWLAMRKRTAHEQSRRLGFNIDAIPSKSPTKHLGLRCLRVMSVSAGAFPPPTGERLGPIPVINHS